MGLLLKLLPSITIKDRYETQKVVALRQAYARDFTNTSHPSAANAPLGEAYCKPLLVPVTDAI